MATNMNKEVMANVGLFNDEIKHAETSDLVIAVKIEAGLDSEAILAEVESLLTKK